MTKYIFCTNKCNFPRTCKGELSVTCGEFLNSSWFQESKNCFTEVKYQIFHLIFNFAPCIPFVGYSHWDQRYSINKFISLKSMHCYIQQRRRFKKHARARKKKIDKLWYFSWSPHHYLEVFQEWVCHILGGTIWKSKSRAFRICMAKEGRESSRPKAELDPCFKKMGCDVSKKVTASQKHFMPNPAERSF